MLLVVGWDGAGLGLVDRFRSQGRMPVLDALMARGRTWKVRSTTPAVTFPAWTTFLTGAEPDQHGITDFTALRPGSYEVRFLNASHRRLPTLLGRLAGEGRRVGMYGVPATWPPEGRCAFEVCGFDTPLGATAGRRSTHPASLGDELRAKHGRLGVEGVPQSRIDEGWHERTLGRLVEDVELRTRIALELLVEHRLDVFVVHFMESDTVGHHFWQFHDRASPRHRRDALAEAIADVYAALDRSLGQLMEAAGAGAELLLLSDHGSAGASDRVVFWNRWLADRGWLRFGRGGSTASAMKRAILGFVPESLQARVFAAATPLAARLESGSRFAGIDWAGTRAFSEELPYFPSLRLNLVGREPRGTVLEEEKDRLLEALRDDLLSWKDPFDGGAVVKAVHRREDLFRGPFAGQLPDLLLELRRPDGYAYAAGASRGGVERQAMRRLTAREASGAKGTATSGVHDEHGLALLVAAGAEPGRDAEVRGLADVGATMLALQGVAPWAHVSGRPLVDSRTSAPAAALSTPSPEPSRDYDEREAREVEQRLRDLGYLP